MDSPARANFKGISPLPPALAQNRTGRGGQQRRSCVLGFFGEFPWLPLCYFRVISVYRRWNALWILNGVQFVFDRFGKLKWHCYFSQTVFVPLLQGQNWAHIKLIFGLEKDPNPISFHYIPLNHCSFWNCKHLFSFLPMWAQASSMDSLNTKVQMSEGT